MITNISISLLKKESEIDASTLTALYTKKASSQLDLSSYKVDIKNGKKLSFQMYEELIKEYNKFDYDYVGLWVCFKNGNIIDNAIDIKSLETIKLNRTDLNPFEEFFDMTVKQ